MSSRAEITRKYARGYAAASKYSNGARKLLQWLWAASGGLCGKYLTAAMASLLAALEQHGELDLPSSPGEYFQQEAGVWLNDGPTFGVAGEGFARLNMATPRPILREIVDRLAAALPA